MKRAIAAGAALLILAAAGCGQDRPGSPADTPGTDELAKRLANAHRENPIRFQDEHVGTQVRARGTVSWIRENGAVGFQNQWVERALVCHFGDLREASQFNRYDRITIMGSVERVNGGTKGSKTVHLRGCSLAEER